MSIFSRYGSLISNMILPLSLFILPILAIQANPLPAPANITWQIGSPIELCSSVRIVGNLTPLLIEQTQQSLDTIWAEKWVPVAVEAPPQSYQPPPTSLPGKQAGFKFWNHRNYVEYGSGCETTINFNISNLEKDLQHGVDESYDLIITSQHPEIQITSGSVWGALHGLKTLEQLFVTDKHGIIQVEQPVSIHDEPLYPHRGIMIDSGRNFLTVETILRQIDIMALSKLNVLHWHITDSQSWPVYVKSYPQMVQSAYSELEIYFPEDVQNIVNYGISKGVRVIPEIDMPGHCAAGWNQIDPSLVTCTNAFWNSRVGVLPVAGEPAPGQLDIINPLTLQVVGNVYNDISNLFSDNFFHVGMDELLKGCYNYSSSVSNWFQQDSSRTYQDLAQYWINNTVEPIFLRNRPNRKLIMWEDSVLSPDFAAEDIPPSKVIMQTWSSNHSNIKTLASKGYDVIISSNDFLYLDCGFGGFVTNDPRYNVQDRTNDISFNYGGSGGSWCAPYKTWQRIYDFDLADNLTLTSSEVDHILGAEVALWGEQVDSTNLESKLWPRTAALAELLWSGNKRPDGTKRTYEMTQRILNFRERLVSRGFNAVPLVPKYCVQHPHACDYFTDPKIIV